MERVKNAQRRLGWLMALVAATSCGCQTIRTPETQIAASPIPREFDKTVMPAYVVEAPDIIRVEVLEGLPGRQLSGERLVRPDGTINLDFYGDIFVAGLTCEEIKEKVVIHLRSFLNDDTLGLVEEDDDGNVKEKSPRESDRVFVDVLSYNSKYYYVFGDVNAPNKMPITGNETVLDALNAVGGLAPTAAVNNIHLVRPAPPGACCEQKLPVNYAAIVYAGDSTTNYQMMPGDRLVVYRDPIVRTSVFIQRLSEPFQNILSATLFYGFTSNTVQNLNQFSRNRVPAAVAPIPAPANPTPVVPGAR